MRISSSGSRRAVTALILWAGVAAPSYADEELGHCAAIGSRDDRLACYDALAAKRAAASPPPAASSAPVAPAPAGSDAPESAPPKKADFGLNAAQLQKIKPQKQIDSISAKVTSVWHSASGHMLLELDNGQSWELDSVDPLLATGNSVTIERGALGSFLLTTPTRRTHHAHRLH